MDITKIVEAVILLVAAIAEVWLVPLIKEKLATEKRAKLIEYVRIAVKAAEQLYEINDGKKKKKYVLEYIEGRGFKIGPEIDAVIEAEVLQLHAMLEEP